ncbi:uncharacterized protein LOC144434949 [Glandiceps talaboti]
MPFLFQLCTISAVMIASHGVMSAPVWYREKGSLQESQPNARKLVLRNSDMDASAGKHAIPGPCQSSKDCSPNQTCDPSGLCISCSAWEGTNHVPEGCTGAKLSKQTINVTPTYVHVPIPDKCSKEADCPLGLWCVQDTGTCESCEELQSNPEVYQIECKRYAQMQHAQEEEKKLQDTIIVSVCAGVLLVCLAAIGLCWFCRRHCKNKKTTNAVAENGEVTDQTELEHLPVNENQDDEQDGSESKEDAYGIQAADRGKERTAFTLNE